MQLLQKTGEPAPFLKSAVEYLRNASARRSLQTGGVGAAPKASSEKSYKSYAAVIVNCAKLTYYSNLERCRAEKRRESGR